ncbi:MAG3450 family membrane protein [Mesomycoplasma hyopneumoniae]|uniref:MAG3450 family membrane protein n=1 Tax=Mesomycoplasma hyopneumoniae TaxID=2099 RepID=UPI003D694856
MYKKITKIPDFLFALLTIILPISLIYAFFSPDFYGKTIISFWILLLITILNFFLCFLISFIWIRLKIVNFSFIFYYPIILFSLSILLVTYPLNDSKSLVILRVFLVFLSVFLIIPSLIIKKKIVQKAQLNLINKRTKKH